MCKDSTTFVGLDVHKDSITVACVGAAATDPVIDVGTIGTLTPVHIPTPDQEAFRDVVRAWQQAKRDITAARQRLKAFLLRNDVRYTGQANWSAAHRR